MLIDRNLIICTTPLQMLIANQIVNKNRNSNFDFLLIALDSNSKYDYYFSKLTSNENVLESFIYNYSQRNSSAQIFIDFIGFISFFNKSIYKDKEYKSIYFASINSRICQYFVSRFHKSKIKTFDDGLANILTDSVYFMNDKPKGFNSFIWKFLGVNIFSQEIREKSFKHYTIYKDVSNICPNVEYVDIYSNKIGLRVLNDEKIVKIFLGQPLMDLDKKFNEKYISNILTKYGIDFYFPHPREKYKLLNIEIIRTHLIFEDFIREFILNSNFSKVELYTFCSSAAFNVSGIEQVEVKFIYDPILKSQFPQIYNLVKLFNFKII